MFFRDTFEVALRTSRVRHGRFELVSEILIVEEHPIISMGFTVVETSLYLKNTRNHVFNFFIAHKRDESRPWSCLNQCFHLVRR